MSIRQNTSEPKAPVYRMFRRNLLVHAPMPHVVYRHLMERVCSSDPDMNGNFHSDIHHRSEDEIERSRSRLDKSLLNRLSLNLLGHIGLFLMQGCSLFIKTLQAWLIVVRIPHQFISVCTVKLALSNYPWTFTVKRIMLIQVDNCKSNRFHGVICNNDNIEDYWCPKPGENPDVMHITLICHMWGLPRTGLLCRNRARARNYANVKDVSNEWK